MILSCLSGSWLVRAWSLGLRPKVMKICPFRTLSKVAIPYLLFAHGQRPVKSDVAMRLRRTFTNIHEQEPSVRHSVLAMSSFLRPPAGYWTTHCHTCKSPVTQIELGRQGFDDFNWLVTSSPSPTALPLAFYPVLFCRAGHHPPKFSRHL